MFADKKDPTLMLSRSAALIPAVVTIICLAPFANKAYHIDDPLFIWGAKQIQKSPSDFYGFSVNWYGSENPMSKVAQNPPFACYYIALAASLFGWDEVAIHIAFLVPAVAVALGTYYLARMFCSRPVTATLAAVLTPVFLVSSSNIMCDTMMLAFWIWAVFLWVRGIEAGRHFSLFFASLLVGICALTKYFGMTLLPLLFVYSLVQKRKLGTWVLYLLVPILMLAGYQWATYELYGRGLLSSAAAYAGRMNWRQGLKFLSGGPTALIFTGGCIITVLFYIRLLWSKKILISGVVLAILLTLIVSYTKSLDEAMDSNNSNSWGYLVQMCLMLLTGISIVGIAVLDFWKCRDAKSLLLFLWVLGTFVFAGFVNWTVNARSILPMTPAVGILLMRRIDQCDNRAGRRTGGWSIAWRLIPAGLVALLVCLADYTWASTARTAAAVIHEKFGRSNRTVWFQGHWGFQYYMENLGGKPVDYVHPEIGLSDIVIIPSNNTNLEPGRVKNMRLQETFCFTPYQNLATMKWRCAGFYTSIWGPLPFAFGSVRPDEYYACVVK